jgi:hypothetical protein
MVWVGVALLVAVLQKLPSYRSAFLAGWCFRVVKTLIVINWFWAAYPVTWIGLEPGLLHVLLVCLYWIPAALTLGLGAGLFALRWHYCKQYSVRVRCVV